VTVGACAKRNSRRAKRPAAHSTSTFTHFSLPNVAVERSSRYGIKVKEQKERLMRRLALSCVASTLVFSPTAALAGELDSCVTLRDVDVPRGSPPAKTARIPRWEPVQVLGHCADVIGGKQQENTPYSQGGSCKVRHGSDPDFAVPLDSLTSRFGACICPSEEQLKELRQQPVSWRGLEGLRVLLWRRLLTAAAGTTSTNDWQRSCYKAYVNTEPADAEQLAAIQSNSVPVDTAPNRAFLAGLYAIDNQREPQIKGASLVQYMFKNNAEQAQSAKALSLRSESLATIPVALDPKNLGRLWKSPDIRKSLLRDTFYHFSSKERADETDWRVYVHVTREHALDVVQFLVKNVVDASKFGRRLHGLKVTAPSQTGIRADSIVIYAKNYDDAKEIANLLKDYQ
jgi:hypothetical protein